MKVVAQIRCRLMKLEGRDAATSSEANSAQVTLLTTNLAGEKHNGKLIVDSSMDVVVA